MLIQSQWQITLGAVVLLDYSDYLESEVRITRAFAIQAEEGVRAPAVRQFGRGNLRHTVSFVRHVECASAGAAADLLALHTRSLPTTPATCVLARIGGRQSLAGALLTAYEATTEAHLFIASYALQGGELTFVDLPEPMVPDDPAPGLTADSTDISADSTAFTADLL